MARRRTSLFDDIFDSLQQLPWWVGVIVAVIFWTVAPRFLPHAGGNATQDALRPIFMFFLKAMAVMSLVAAAVSAIKSLSRKKLLDRQSGIDSLRDLSWREFEHLVGEAYRRQRKSRDRQVMCSLSRGGFPLNGFTYRLPSDTILLSWVSLGAIAV